MAALFIASHHPTLQRILIGSFGDADAALLRFWICLLPSAHKIRQLGDGCITALGSAPPTLLEFSRVKHITITMFPGHQKRSREHSKHQCGPREQQQMMRSSQTPRTPIRRGKGPPRTVIALPGSSEQRQEGGPQERKWPRFPKEPQKEDNLL